MFLNWDLLKIIDNETYSRSRPDVPDQITFGVEGLFWPIRSEIKVFILIHSSFGNA